MLTGCPCGHALQNNNLHTRSYLAHMSNSGKARFDQSRNLLHRSIRLYPLQYSFDCHLLKSVFELQENLILYRLQHLD